MARQENAQTRVADDNYQRTTQWTDEDLGPSLFERMQSAAARLRPHAITVARARIAATRNRIYDAFVDMGERRANRRRQAYLSSLHFGKCSDVDAKAFSSVYHRDNDDLDLRRISFVDAKGPVSCVVMTYPHKGSYTQTQTQQEALASCISLMAIQAGYAEHGGTMDKELMSDYTRACLVVAGGDPSVVRDDLVSMLLAAQHDGVQDCTFEPPKGAYEMATLAERMLAESGCVDMSQVKGFVPNAMQRDLDPSLAKPQEADQHQQGATRNKQPNDKTPPDKQTGHADKIRGMHRKAGVKGNHKDHDPHDTKASAPSADKAPSVVKSDMLVGPQPDQAPKVTPVTTEPVTEQPGGTVTASGTPTDGTSSAEADDFYDTDAVPPSVYDAMADEYAYAMAAGGDADEPATRPAQEASPTMARHGNGVVTNVQPTSSPAAGLTPHGKGVVSGGGQTVKQAPPLADFDGDDVDQDDGLQVE